MSYLGSRENAKSDIAAVDPYNAPKEASSPGLMGGSKPGSMNKLASETLTLKRTSMSSAAMKGEGVKRRDE
jgi:hypothetical protein